MFAGWLRSRFDAVPKCRESCGRVRVLPAKWHGIGHIVGASRLRKSMQQRRAVLERPWITNAVSIGAFILSIAAVITGCVQQIQTSKANDEKDRTRYAESVRWWEPDSSLTIANTSPVPIYAVAAWMTYGGVVSRTGVPVTRRVELVGVVEPCTEFVIESSTVAPAPAQVDGIYFAENGRSWFRGDSGLVPESQPTPDVRPAGRTSFLNSSAHSIPSCSRSG
jgi:hypothetical protein